MSLSRRQFLKASAVALCVGASSRPGYANIPQKLPIPPLIEARNGRPVFLSMYGANWSFSQNKSASVWGFNGHYLGPTIRVYNNDNVKLSCANHLYEVVGLTISGLQVPGAIINSPARVIWPESSWSPVLPIRQAACTGWYHANTAKNMARQVYNGLAGMWLIEDANSNHQGLPNQYGVNDFPVILQDKQFSFSGAPQYDPPYSEGFLGDTLVTNGVSEPILDVGRTWIRLRLLNASSARRYSLSLTDQQPMYLIASDQGLLNAPVMLTELNLAPGERKEILIDMSKTTEVSLITGTSQGFVDNIRRIFEYSNILPETKALTLRSSGTSTAIYNQLPESFNLNNGDINYSALQSREFMLKSDGTINDMSWQASRIDVSAKFNSQERWLIKTDLPQAFHIQGAQFLVVSVGGKLPAAEDKGWKDTVWIDEPVELLVRFTQISSASNPFLYYSQNLDLADAGTMGQLVVT